MDKYTSQIQSSAAYLKQMGKELDAAYLAWLIFKGLPSNFDAFASRKFEEIGKNLDTLDIPQLISELISEEARMQSSETSSQSFVAKNANKSANAA